MSMNWSMEIEQSLISEIPSVQKAMEKYTHSMHMFHIAIVYIYGYVSIKEKLRFEQDFSVLMVKT